MKRLTGWMCLAAVVAAGIVPVAVFGQSVRSLVREGNSQYRSQKYADAEVSYRKALEKDQDLVPGQFNLGNALYRQDKSDEAVMAYENAIMKAGSKEEKAHAYFNMGDAFMKGQHYQEAVKSYIESLKLNPGDQDTKYNLSYALAKMREQQQQQQKQQNKNDKNNKNKDKKQDQQKNEQNQDQQKQDEQQQKKQQTPQEKQQSQEKKMAKAEAERILDVLKNNEKDVQKKLRVRQAVRVKTDKDW